MANAKNTIRQHEIIRVPKGWEGQAKALVIQLNRVLDDIYAQFNLIASTINAERALAETDEAQRSEDS